MFRHPMYCLRWVSDERIYEDGGPKQTAEDSWIVEVTSRSRSLASTFHTPDLSI